MDVIDAAIVERQAIVIGFSDLLELGRDAVQGEAILASASEEGEMSMPIGRAGLE